jgi:hypothetical protein
VEVDGLILKPKRVPNVPSQPIDSLFAGHRHSALITTNGSVLVWGRNTSGELGIGRLSEAPPQPVPIQAFDGEEPIRTMAIGHDHTIFADERGGLWTCGSNVLGQLGLGLRLSATSQLDAAQRATSQGSMPMMLMKRQINNKVRISCWCGIVRMHSRLIYGPDTPVLPARVCMMAFKDVSPLKMSFALPICLKACNAAFPRKE